MVLTKLIQEMEKGKISTEIIRSLISQNPSIIVEKNVNNNVGDLDFYHRVLDHHLMVALQVNINSLSMLKSCEFEGSFIKKRKIDHENDSLFDDQYESQERCTSNTTTTRRGCYKRSKTSESTVEEVSHVTDDGFVWRKYGQKIIQDTNHPRNYYRCAHKQDQKCEATKQVQQISENPTKYKIIYHGNHKCTNNYFLRTTQFIIDDTPKKNSSSFFLSFDQSNKLNPKLLPTSALFQGAGFWKLQQNKSTTEEVSTVSHDESYTIKNNCLENINTPQDLTNTSGQSSSSNFVLENSQDIIAYENCTSSTASSFDFVQDYSYMFDDLSGVLQDYWWD